jgi:uncharacterized membrane protein YbhN (UPF0104 family)
VDDRAGPQSVAPRRRALRIAAAVAVTGGLAALIALAVPYGEVADAFRGLEPLWLVPMLAAYTLTFPCRAARFRSLGVPLSLPALTGVSAIHQCMNRLLPLRTGEFAFPVLVRRLCGKSLVEGLALVALCLLLDLVIVVVAFLAALLAVPQARDAVGPVGTALIVAALPVLLAGYLLLPGLGSRLARRLGERLAPRHPKAAERLARAADTLEAVRTLSRRGFFGAVVWTVLQWATLFVTFWSALAATGIDLGPAEVVAGSTAAIIAAAVPVGGVGSFGTLEGGWAAGFVLVGVPRGPAVASALVVSATSLVLVLVLAAISWAFLGRRRPPAGGSASA